MAYNLVKKDTYKPRTVRPYNNKAPTAPAKWDYGLPNQLMVWARERASYYLSKSKKELADEVIIMPTTTEFLRQHFQREDLPKTYPEYSEALDWTKNRKDWQSVAQFVDGVLVPELMSTLAMNKVIDVTFSVFWLKCRAQWIDTQHVSLSKGATVLYLDEADAKA